MFVNPYTSLASVPDMFGDSFLRGGTLTLLDSPSAALTTMLVTDLALAGATRRMLVAEHNKALPVDRIYFNYNHYQNALSADASLFGPAAGLFTTRRFPIEQYMLGWEKTFADARWSAELRMPLANRNAFDVQFPTGPERAAVSTGEVGNLAVILKRVLYRDCCHVISAGLGIDTPTGSDAVAETANTRLELENDAVYLSPFLAGMWTPSDRMFWHGFAQLDVPVAENSIDFQTFGILPPTTVTAGYRDQVVLHLDLGTGYWLYRRPCQCQAIVTGLAALVEVHYTTTLDDTDIAAGSVGVGFPTASFDVRNAAGQVDAVNLTAGLHAELAHQTTLRVAGAFPLRQGDNRFFDAEILAQLSRRF